MKECDPLCRRSILEMFFSSSFAESAEGRPSQWCLGRICLRCRPVFLMEAVVKKACLACLANGGNASSRATSPWSILGRPRESRAVVGGADSATGACILNTCMQHYCQQSIYALRCLCVSPAALQQSCITSRLVCVSLRAKESVGLE